MNGPSAAATAPKEAPRVKGPIVWLDMDQRELDDAYDQLVYAPNRNKLTKTHAGRWNNHAERLALLFGIGTRAVPSWGPRTRRSQATSTQCWWIV
jgi:hypothetical protein